MKKELEKFCEEYGLGNLISKPKQVSGGLLHTMYFVETGAGKFAIKVLNPEIMQRQEALQNMINSERVSHALESVVPVVAAKEFNGEHVIKLDGIYNYEKFKALLAEYAASIEVDSVDWNAVLTGSFDGMLGWLEYNVKRAAGLIGSDVKECKAGEEQVLGTIAEMKRQKAQLQQMRSWLYEFR